MVASGAARIASVDANMKDLPRNSKRAKPYSARTQTATVPTTTMADTARLWYRYVQRPSRYVQRHQDGLKTPSWSSRSTYHMSEAAAGSCRGLLQSTCWRGCASRWMPSERARRTFGSWTDEAVLAAACAVLPRFAAAIRRA